MDFDPDPPPSYSLVAPKVLAPHDERVVRFLQKANLSLPELIPELPEPEEVDFRKGYAAPEAQSLLVDDRVSQFSYRDPQDQKIRHLFRSSSRREKKYNTEKWEFSLHEVGRTFHALISQEDLPDAGVAQAMLAHARDVSVDELWCHFRDAKLEKRMNSIFRRSKSTAYEQPTWLYKATKQDNLDYMRVLCQMGVDKEILNHAFGVALVETNSMSAMSLLLQYGAVADAYTGDIRDRFESNDVALARLLLSAPGSMEVKSWQWCLEGDVGVVRGPRRHEILLLCLAHAPEVVSAKLLMKALEEQKFDAAAIILAYAEPEDFDDIDLHHEGCEYVTKVPDKDQRYRFFSMLHECGFLHDSGTLCEELYEDVRLRHEPLIKLLVEVGVSIDAEPNSAINYAVSKMDLEVVRLLKDGHFTSPVNFVLGSVPHTALEEHMLSLLEMIAPGGIAGEPLDLQLIRAVGKGHARLTEKMLSYGASVEYSDAQAIKEALYIRNFAILEILLQAPCSPMLLSTAVPAAMSIDSRADRLKAVEALVEKGVVSTHLGLPLQMAISEAGSADVDLIRLLLWYKAPVDVEGHEADGSVLVATKRANLTVLEMLCEGGPKKSTLSSAVPVAFDTIGNHGYEVAFEMIKLLLYNGATGTPVNETLVAAARRDTRLSIVRILVPRGADANYATGQSFAVALESRNFELLKVLCAGCPPSQSSLERLLFVAASPDHYDMKSLDLLLSCPGSATALNAAWSSEKFKGNPNINAIVPCLLKHGLSVNLHSGEILCFAVREHNVVLLKSILASDPDEASLRAAFKVAASKNKPETIDLMSLLLDKANSAEIGQSEALYDQTITAVLNGNLDGIALLLRHNASVNHEDGKVVKFVSAAGSLNILDVFLGSSPNSKTISEAFLATAASESDPETQLRVFKRLVSANGGMTLDQMAKLLREAIRQHRNKILLPQFLMSRNVPIEFETLELALKVSSLDLFVLLVNETSSSAIAALFNAAINTDLGPGRRYRVYAYLLDRGVPTPHVSDALISSLSKPFEDLSLQKLLLQHGASVEHRGCGCFAAATRVKSLDAVRLLSQYITNDDMANAAFDHVRKGSLRNDMRREVYHCFKPWSLKRQSVDKALMQNLKTGPDEGIVRFLLEKGADPNKDVQSFVLAATESTESTFRALSKHATLHLAFKALMNHFNEEWQVVWWFKACLEEQSQASNIQDDGLLFQCITKFPRGDTLVKLLIDNGVSAATQKSLSLCPGWEAESCTIVIWALFAKPRVENDVILALLSRCTSDIATYKTPTTKISAAFACLLDKTRTPVLEELLQIDKDHVLDYTISGPQFSYLAAYPKSHGIGVDTDLHLDIASLYLGNLDAFLLLGGGEHPDDESLHFAALFALPDFVDYLLDHHDANYRSKKFDGYIPMAMACMAQDNPWSKFANEQGSLRTRQKETIDLLKPVTKFDWSAHRETLLHVALAQGVEVTDMMIEALDIAKDPERDEAYLYLDKEGVWYSPQQWLLRIRPETKDKQRLIKRLDKAGMASRYFKKVLPGEGTQPVGFHGLPMDYDLAWTSPTSP
jgi:ankyrin repeat protein